MMQDERIRKGNQTIIQSFFGWWIGVAVVFVILKYFFGNQFWLESLPEWVVIIISSLVIGITQFLKHQNEVVDERLEEEIGKWYRWSFYAMIILSIIAYMIQVVMTTNYQEIALLSANSFMVIMMDFTVIVYLIKAHQMRFYLNHRIIELPMKSFLLQILKRIGIILLAALIIGLFGSFLATVYREDLSPWLPFAVSLLSAFSISFWMVMLSYYERNSWNEYILNLDEQKVSLVSPNYMLFFVWGMLLNLFYFSAVQINNYVLSNHDSFQLSIMMNVMVLFAKVLFFIAIIPTIIGIVIVVGSLKKSSPTKTFWIKSYLVLSIMLLVLSTASNIISLFTPLIVRSMENPTPYFAAIAQFSSFMLFLQVMMMVWYVFWTRAEQVRGWFLPLIVIGAMLLSRFASPILFPQVIPAMKTIIYYVVLTTLWLIQQTSIFLMWWNITHAKRDLPDAKPTKKPEFEPIPNENAMSS